MLVWILVLASLLIIPFGMCSINICKTVLICQILCPRHFSGFIHHISASRKGSHSPSSEFYRCCFVVFLFTRRAIGGMLFTTASVRVHPSPNATAAMLYARRSTAIPDAMWLIVALVMS